MTVALGHLVQFHCVINRNFILFPGVEILWKSTVSAVFRLNRPKLCRNCAFPQILWNYSILRSEWNRSLTVKETISQIISNWFNHGVCIITPWFNRGRTTRAKPISIYMNREMYVYVVYDIQVFLILLLSVLIRHNTITNKACYGQ